MKTCLSFLRQLEKNNNREWFKGHSEGYESAKEELLLLTEGILKNSPDFAPELQSLKARECIFRIYRDTRFSKNKTPYKNNMGAYFSKGGKKSPFAGYYLHIQPGASFIAGGLWMPDPKELQLIRQEIYFQPDRFLNLIEAKKFKSLFGELEGEKLKNVPKGFDKDHQAAEWLKMKSFIVSIPFGDSQVNAPDFLKVIIKQYQSMAPLIDFLNQALEMQE